jgi:V/A-type H+-transporting ATPase subunit B
MMKEYKTITEIAGPLVTVSDVSGVGYSEIVEIMLPNGERRKGQVLDVSKNTAVVQVFGPTAGISTDQTTVRFLGETMRLGLSSDMLGRVFNGLGEPRDKGHPQGEGGHLRAPDQPILQRDAERVHPDGNLDRRCDEHAG